MEGISEKVGKQKKMEAMNRYFLVDRFVHSWILNKNIHAVIQRVIWMDMFMGTIRSDSWYYFGATLSRSLFKKNFFI